MLAIAGPNCECLFGDIGTNGRMSDSGIWNKSSLCRAIENRDIGLSEPRALPYHLEKIPFVILDDDAFASKNYMMKTLPLRNLTIEKRTYNCRHSRAKRISGNMFGIHANRWSVFHTTMHLSPERATSVTLSALIFHNYLLKSPSKITYCTSGLIDQEDKKDNVVALVAGASSIWQNNSYQSLLNVMEITFQTRTWERFLWTVLWTKRLWHDSGINIKTCNNNDTHDVVMYTLKICNCITNM